MAVIVKEVKIRTYRRQRQEWQVAGKEKQMSVKKES